MLAKWQHLIKSNALSPKKGVEKLFTINENDNDT